MSVKIYEGYKINTTDLLVLENFSNTYKNKYKEKLYEDVKSKINSEYLLLEELIEDFRNEKYLYSKLFQNLNYYKMSIAFYPLEKYTLFQPFGDFQEKFSKVTGVEYYGYWDNTDPDETCTEKQWEQRHADWNKVLLNKSSIPQNEAFLKNITTRDDLQQIIWQESGVL